MDAGRLAEAHLDVVDTVSQLRVVECAGILLDQGIHGLLQRVRGLIDRVLRSGGIRQHAAGLRQRRCEGRPSLGRVLGLVQRLGTLNQ